MHHGSFCAEASRVRQTPNEHGAPPHECPHELQLFGSVWELTQALPQHKEGHTDVTHCPLALQITLLLPEHGWVCPETQTPVQTPAIHVEFVQDAPLACQVPVASHFSGHWPEHWSAPGLHATQVELRHAGVAPLQIEVVRKVPSAWHVCIALPEHCFWPGAHTPEQTPLKHV